jgi:hypothetical protein
VKITREQYIRFVIDIVTKQNGTNTEVLKYTWLAVLDATSIEAKIALLRELLPPPVFQALVLSANCTLERFEDDIEGIPTSTGLESVYATMAPEDMLPKEYWVKLAELPNE